MTGRVGMADGSDVTKTLAELYLKQGYAEEARDAFALLRQRNPHSPEVEQGLVAAQAEVNRLKRDGLHEILQNWRKWSEKVERDVSA